jgi:hypothetical protein
LGTSVFLERLNSICLLIPLFRAREDDTESFYKIAADFLPDYSAPTFAQLPIDEYLTKTKAIPPDTFQEDPKAASGWARLPDFDSFVEIWIALYGRSEGHSVAGICNQFWRANWQHGIAR